MNGFSIRHYAGTVIYDAKDFLAKNDDKASVETVDLLQTSQVRVARKYMV